MSRNFTEFRLMQIFATLWLVVVIALLGYVILFS